MENSPLNASGIGAAAVDAVALKGRSLEADRQQALDFLYERIDYERSLAMPYDERELKLDRMRSLLERVGQPQQGLPVVHVAGTKGKGSTAAMLAAVLSAAGYRTGLFSSPHLDRIEERLAVDGQPCAPEELVSLVNDLRPVVAAADEERGREAGFTYFELTTAMAWMHFRRRQAQAGVLEVGMGGRLDATNVCEPAVTVITSISYDHMRQLGNTLAAIAREKAGIIKPGVPTVSGVLADEPRRVIEDVCQRQSSRLVQLGRDFNFVYRAPRDLDQRPMSAALDFQLAGEGPFSDVKDVELRLLGRHQGANAAVALAAAHELVRQGWNISPLAARRGLVSVAWPARVEVVARRPTVVIDAAHNVASVQALVDTLAESFSARRRVLVFATTQDKETPAMLRLLLPRFDRVILTRYQNNPRGVPLQDLADEVARIREGQCLEPPALCPTPREAWDEVAAHATPEDLVCVTGSFFIAAEMRAELNRRPLGGVLETSVPLS